MKIKSISIFKNNITSNAIYTILDQGALSIINFIIGLSFIYFASPEDYGYYTMLMGIFHLFASSQNAIINTPMMVLSPRMSKDKSKIFRDGLFILLLAFLFIVFAVMIVILKVSKLINNNFGNFIIPISICFLLLRDYLRTEEFSKLNPKKALRRDALYSIFSLIGIILVIQLNLLNVTIMFLTIGAVAAIITYNKIFSVLKDVPSFQIVKQTFQKSWNYSRWSLIGVFSSWVQGNMYIYVPFFLIGVKEVAFLAAARLLMTPIMLIITSWGNFMRPLLSKEISQRSHKSITILIQATLLLILILLLYTVLLLGVLKLIPYNLLPKEYRGIELFIILWFLVYLFKLMRNNLSNYFQAALRFKYLAFIGMVLAIITIIITIIFVYRFNSYGAVIGLIVSEFLFCIILLLSLMRTKGV